MQEGRPFQLSQVLPRGISPDDFYIGLTGIVALVCVAMIMLRFSDSGKHRLARKAKELQDRRRDYQAGLLAPKKHNRPEIGVDKIRAIVNKLQIVKKLQVDRAESTLIEAGFRSKDAMIILAFVTMLLPIILTAAGVMITQMIELSPKMKIMQLGGPVLGAYLGLKLPWMYIARARKKRYHQIQKALPDMLDLMTICAEAGLSLSIMLDRVSREMAIAYPELSEELALTSIELGFLPDRNKALTNLATRCTLPEVRGIVSVLIQTEKYGTPIAQAMRVLSKEFRQTRMMRAEEKAARLPAMMTVPMIVFILPTLFIVIIAPAAISLMSTLNK